MTYRELINYMKLFADNFLAYGGEDLVYIVRKPNVEVKSETKMILQALRAEAREKKQIKRGKYRFEMGKFTVYFMM